MIFEPDTQWQAYMAFFGSPSADQVKQSKQFQESRSGECSAKRRGVPEAQAGGSDGET